MPALQIPRGQGGRLSSASLLVQGGGEWCRLEIGLGLSLTIQGLSQQLEKEMTRLNEMIVCCCLACSNIMLIVVPCIRQPSYKEPDIVDNFT